MQQEVKPRDGKVIVHGQVGICKTVKSADIVLYHKPNVPLAIIEEKQISTKLVKAYDRG